MTARTVILATLAGILCGFFLPCCYPAKRTPHVFDDSTGEPIDHPASGQQAF